LGAAEYRQMTQDVLAGQTLAIVAARYHVTVNDVRALVHRQCQQNNPARYRQWGAAHPPSLYHLRLYAADYGYTPSSFYARRREELTHA
jgi:hypothetical protein